MVEYLNYDALKGHIEAYADIIINILLIALVYLSRILSIIIVALGLIVLALQYLFLESNNPYVEVIKYIYYSLLINLLNFVCNFLLSLIKISAINNLITGPEIVYWCYDLASNLYKPIGDFICTLNFHQLIDTNFSNASILNLSDLRIIGAIGLLITFSYLLAIIREKGVLATQLEEIKTNNYLSIIIDYYGIFYFIAFIVMFIYLIDQSKRVELFIYIFTIIIFSLNAQILKATIYCLYHYNSLSGLNEIKIPQLRIWFIHIIKQQTLRNFIESTSRKISKNILLSIFIWILVAYFF